MREADALKAATGRGLSHQLVRPPLQLRLDAELPSRERMVSAAQRCTPLVRIRSALPLPLPRTGEPNKQSERNRDG